MLNVGESTERREKAFVQQSSILGENAIKTTYSKNKLKSSLYKNGIDTQYNVFNKTFLKKNEFIYFFKVVNDYNR